MSEKMIAYCGLDCAVCPAYKAAERRTMVERQQTADEWSKQFNVVVKAEEVDCVGCTVRAGQHIGHCAMCAIRVCGLGQATAVVNCAACPDYGCEKLSQFLANVPQAKANLEALRT
jgi:hypothetical protein